DLDEGRRPPVPGRNGSVQIGEDEGRGTTISAIVHWERRSVGIVDLAGRASSSHWRDCNVAGWRVDGRHLSDGRPVGNGEESGGLGPLVRGPERARGAVRNAPGGDEFGFGDRGPA